MFKYLKKAESLGATFTDIRFERNKTRTIEISSNGKSSTKYITDEGYMIRTIVNRNLGVKATNKIDESEIEDAIRSAIGDERINIVYLPSKHATVRIGKDFNKSIEEQFYDLEKIANSIRDLHTSIRAFSIKYFEKKYHKEYYSTEDREIITDGNLSGLYINIIAREGDVIAKISDSLSSHLGYVLDVFNINEFLERLRNRITNQLKGKEVKNGEYDVILAPQVVGDLVNKMGLLAKADSAVNNELYKFRGKRIAPEFVNIIDSPTLDNPKAIGYLLYDDEGVEGRQTKIIENGKLKDFITDRYYSAYLGQSPTGNARAQSFRDLPSIITRNIYLQAGDKRLEELFEGIKEGYYLVSSINEETSDETFQFKIQEGYRIENGEIKEPIRGVKITGNVIETIGKIDMTSKEFDLYEKYNMEVSYGGPFVRILKVKMESLI
ncbi:MAG: TldD/PmbA family protein [Saccharolobus sp.]